MLGPRGRVDALTLGNVGTEADVPLLEAALTHDEPLVREPATWARARLRRLADRV